MSSSFGAVFRMAYDDSVPGKKRLSPGEMRRVARHFRAHLEVSARLILCNLVISGINWKLSLLAIAILPAFILPTRRVGQTRKQITKETQERTAELVARVTETLSISGHLMVRLFGRERWEADRFREKNDEVRTLTMRTNLVGRWFFFFLALFASVGPALVWAYGGWLTIQGALTIGTIV